MQFTIFALALAASTLAAPLEERTSSGVAVVDAAKKEVGDGYAYGAGSCNGPTNGDFDCSGLTQYALCQAVHKTIPRTAQEQYDSSMGTKLARGSAQAGDLVFWTTGSSCSSGVEHVAVVMGSVRSGYIVAAADPSQGVLEQPLWTSSGGLTICPDAVRFW